MMFSKAEWSEMIVAVDAKIANAPCSLPEEKSVQFRHAFLRVAPSMFLGALDQTIIAAALPAIAGSAACFVAPNLISLVGARALQGFGGGGLMTLHGCRTARP
jgi:hypothetical protein